MRCFHKNRLIPTEVFTCASCPFHAVKGVNVCLICFTGHIYSREILHHMQDDKCTLPL